MTIISNDIHTALYLPDEANIFYNSEVGGILTSSFFTILCLWKLRHVLFIWIQHLHFNVSLNLTKICKQVSGL